MQCQPESVLPYFQYHKSYTHAMDDCVAVKRLIEESLAERNQEKTPQFQYQNQRPQGDRALGFTWKPCCV